MADVRCPIYDASLISRDRPALIDRNRKIIYWELNEFVTEAAGQLAAQGVRPGERVALFLQQDWRYVVALMGLLRLGAVACPISTRLPVQAVRAQLDGIACRRLVAHVGEASRGVLDGLSVLDPSGLFAEPGLGHQHTPSHHIPLDRPATILFTSGSTGGPRAALHSYGNHYYSARGANANIRLTTHDRWLLTLPLYHVGGLGILFRCFLAGAAVALPDAGEALEAAQARLEATHLSLVSTQLRRLLQLPEWPESFARVKAAMLGGGAVDEALLQAARARRLPVYPSYGLTEMASQVTAVRPDTPPAQRGTSGAVLKHRQLRLATDGGIQVRGQTLFAGYVTGEALERPLTEDEWFDTGDLGALDEAGYLTVRGRRDNLFISGGENIQPEEIERRLCAIEGVEEAVVVPVDDAEFGQRPAAFLRFRAAPVPDAALTAALEAVLPRYKIPVRYLPWPEDAAAGSMKPDRAALRALANG